MLGILYGIAFLLTMNYAILPLSAIGRSIIRSTSCASMRSWHIVLVGLPAAFFVTRAVKSG